MDTSPFSLKRFESAMYLQHKLELPKLAQPAYCYVLVIDSCGALPVIESFGCETSTLQFFSATNASVCLVFPFLALKASLAFLALFNTRGPPSPKARPNTSFNNSSPLSGHLGSISAVIVTLSIVLIAIVPTHIPRCNINSASRNWSLATGLVING